MNCPILRVFAVLATVPVWASVLPAADDFKIPNPKKDPVAMAFTLPRGMVLTPKEYEYANRVRAQLEPRLRAALDRVENASDKNEKVKAAKEVREIKSAIQVAVNTILQQRYMAAMQEAAKQAAERRKAIEKKNAHRKKGGHKKKRKR